MSKVFTSLTLSKIRKKSVQKSVQNKKISLEEDIGNYGNESQRF